MQDAYSGGVVSGELSGVPQTAKVEGTVSHNTTLISDPSHKFKAFSRLAQLGQVIRKTQYSLMLT